MASTERRLSSGPANSRLARILFYLADGTMAGAVLYFALTQVVFLASGLERWMIAVLLVFLAIGTLHGWAWLMAARSQLRRSDAPQSRLSREWKETRRWTRVAVVALPVAGVLVGVAVTRWGWEFWWRPRATDSLVLGTLGLGLVLRLLLRRAISSDGGRGFLPGTRRGLVGFLVVLLGLLAVLTWGGVSTDVLLFVVVGIGGYGLLYLLAAAGVE